MIRFDKRTAIELAALAAFIGIASYIFYTFGFFDFFADRRRLIAFIQEHRGYAELLFIGLQIVQVIAAPVPGEVTGFAGGILFGTTQGILLSTIGLTLGSWLAFSLSKLIGRPIVELVARPETIKRYDYVMKHKGLFLSFLMFLIPGFPKDILCYILGLGHMRHRDFLIVSTAGRLLGTILLTVGGSFFRNARYGAFFTIAGISIGLILLVMIYRERIEQWFRKIRASQQLKARARRRNNRKSAT